MEIRGKMINANSGQRQKEILSAVHYVAKKKKEKQRSEDRWVFIAGLGIGAIIIVLMILVGFR